MDARQPRYVLSFEASTETRDAIDAFALENDLNRSDALRVLIAQGLVAKGRVEASLLVLKSEAEKQAYVLARTALSEAMKAVKENTKAEVVRGKRTTSW